MAEQADSLITVIAVRRSVARDCMVMEGAELIQYGCAVCNSTVPTTKYDTLISRSCRSVNAGLATKQNKHVLVAPTFERGPDRSIGDIKIVRFFRIPQKNCSRRKRKFFLLFLA